MQKNDSTEQAHSMRRKVKSSTTLNRKYVKRPIKSGDVMAYGGGMMNQSSDTMVHVSRSPKISHFNSMETMKQQSPLAKTVIASSTAENEQIMARPQPHPMQSVANAKMRSRLIMVSSTSEAKLTAKQLKDQAIQKALAEASAKDTTTTKQSKSKAKKQYSAKKIGFGFGRVMLALGCTAAAVFAIIYFVNLNMPDMSLKVAAMQTGISASYPTYAPNGYRVSGITSEDKKITIEFKNTDDNTAYTLTEEASSWDSNALLNNYVKESYGEDFSTVREQGLTIYISSTKATWVSCGVKYEIDAEGAKLTNKQIRAIATSL